MENVPGDMVRSKTPGYKPVPQLLAELELLGNALITSDVGRVEIIQQTPALAYHHEQSTAGTMVLLVGLEVLRKLTDALAQNRDLHFGAARVRTVDAVLLDHALFLISR